MMSLQRKIEAMLELEFYAKCKCHEDQTKKYFCWDCKEPAALCETCKECQHSAHNVKQVYRASRTAAIRASDAQTMFEISDIQHHSNNSWLVVYLYTRSTSSLEGDKGRPIVRTAKRRCQECGYDMTKEGYKFCSIQCQNAHQMVMKESDLSHKRRRRRKGIPIRAPLF